MLAIFSAAERDIGINIHCWIHRRKHQRISLIELLFMRMFNKMTSKRFITFQWSSLVTDKEPDRKNWNSYCRLRNVKTNKGVMNKLPSTS